MKFTSYMDEWSGNNDVGSDIPLSIDNCSSYLRMLDGKRHTQILVVNESKKSNLLIGGGPLNFVVTLTEGNDEHFYNLLNIAVHGNDTDEVEVITGGQAGYFQKRYCIDFVKTLEALKYYLSTSALHPALQWEKQ